MYSDTIEKNYIKTTSVLYRKKFAQFFTPEPIADLMVKWIVGNNDLKNVLEPAFGLGIFSRLLLKYNKTFHIKAFEIDKNIFDEAKKVFNKHKNVNLLLEDYMYNDWNNRYDGIICNPPYLKFHDYDNKNILKELKNKLSISLNGFANLYVLFLLKSIYQLNKNGRVAYIIPSEFLNSNYGHLVKDYLIRNRTLRHVIIIDFKENVFDNVITTASILLFANDNKDENISFYNIESIDDIKKIEKMIKSYPNDNKKSNTVKFEKLDPSIKWRFYYKKQNSIKFKNLVPFSTYGKVMRGIATGSNEYFTFNLSKAIKYKIKKEHLLPCICKSSDIKTSFFTEFNYEELQNNDKKSFLLNAQGNENDINIKKYLKFGEEQEIHKKYLTSKRTPWYSLENRQPAPILVSVFNRNGLKFIKNEAKISNLTTFHCIYLNMFYRPKENLFFAYLLTDIAKQIFDDNRREYGNGLKKFEPNDINKAMMIDLDKISKDTESDIFKYYSQYRKSIIYKQPDEGLLEKINEIFLREYAF